LGGLVRARPCVPLSSLPALESCFFNALVAFL
jgi:hypothetical protein